MNSLDFLQRTHTCGELRKEHIDQEVILNGWVQRRRDLGGLIFIDLRDRFGITQVVFNPQENPDLFKQAEGLKNEYVIAVAGNVRRRPEGADNKSLPTGEIEINVSKIQILSSSKSLPFTITDDLNIDESHRLKYRYLDLRRPKMLSNFVLRHKFSKAIRDFLDKMNFLEVETPSLIRSTPEGARDFLVPSRITPGAFYALPQSPQLLKQLLMVSGFDRYFQIARCFRDEDLRADRQPEFTQIDMEMSFVKQDDVLHLVEALIKYCFHEVLNEKVNTPFPRMSWDEAQKRYGSDKPDTRFEMEIKDITQIVKNTTFQVFIDIIGSGGVIRGIKLPGCAGYSRKQIDDLSNFVKQFGAKGVIPIALKPGEFKSPLDKHLDEQAKKNVIEALEANEGDLVILMAGEERPVGTILGRLRLHMGKELGLIDFKRHDFLWITDFPMFAYDEENDKLEMEHHAFTSPRPEDMCLLDTDPLKMRAWAYDLVFNGNEVASGSIRIHDRDLQEKIFKAIGMPKEEAYERFSFLLNAFEYGVPPHGGLALGYDRIIAEICGEESIREVIAFPKNSNGQCLLTGAPFDVEDEQLEVLKLEVLPEAKEKRQAATAEV